MRHAHRLLHVVGDDGDGVVAPQFVDQFLDLGGRDRIERRAGLVEQDHFRLDRHGAGDAQALLLAAGQAEAAGVELVLDLVPDRRAAQRLFDPLVHIGLAELLVEPDAEGDIVVDRHRERRRLLEHHADAGAQAVDVQLGDRGCSRRRAAPRLSARWPRIEVVHAVEHAQQRRLAAARRADEGRRLVGVERHADRFQRLGLAVEEIEILGPDIFSGELVARRPERSCEGNVGHLLVLCAPRTRAVIDKARTARVMRSAPAQASDCQSL